MANWSVISFLTGEFVTAAKLNVLYNNTAGIVANMQEIFDNCVLGPTGFEGPTSGNLSHTIAAGEAIIYGYRVEKTATAHTYTASKDTYVDLTYDGSYLYSEVANGAAEPLLTAGYLRLMKVVTNATQITSVKDLARRQVTLRESVWRSGVTDFRIVGNTTTETELFRRVLHPNAFFHIGDGTYQNRKIVVKVVGRYENSSGGSSNFTLRLKYGATTIGQLTFTDPNHAGGSEHPIFAEFNFLMGDYCYSKMEVGPPLASASNPVSSATAGQFVYGKYDSVPEDWTLCLDLVLTAQHSVANAATQFTFIHTSIELV